MLVSKLFKGLRERPLPEVGRYGVILARNALGLANPMRNADRETLEHVILPVYAGRQDIATVLFVGCEWYTKHYQTLLPGRTYLTIDPDPWKSRFGSRQHIVAGLEKLGEHVQPGSLDLILCNGVVGWGLDDRDDCEQAFRACFDALRPAGELVIGWNDQPEHRPVDLASLEALRRFAPVTFGPLGTTQYLANAANRHFFNFYVKPDSGAPRR
jgi:SAM-dependent methyltransferase